MTIWNDVISPVSTEPQAVADWPTRSRQYRTTDPDFIPLTSLAQYTAGSYSLASSRLARFTARSKSLSISWRRCRGRFGAGMRKLSTI